MTWNPRGTGPASRQACAEASGGAGGGAEKARALAGQGGPAAVAVNEGGGKEDRVRVCEACPAEIPDIWNEKLCPECWVKRERISGALRHGDAAEAFRLMTGRPRPEQAQGVKHDAGKPMWRLLPWGPLEDVVKVLTFGAAKYAPDNWQRVPEAKDRYLDAALRHLVARAGGERLDPESGLPHLAHAVCCCLFLDWFDRKETP